MSKKGAVMIYILLSTMVLLTLSAFVINLEFSYTIAEQAKTYTRLLSLTSLEQFYDVLKNYRTNGIPQGGNFLSTFGDDVKQRVNEIAKQNRFTGHKDKQFLDFSFNWDNASNGGGTLTPGVYYFDSTESVPGCNSFPCFVASDPAEMNNDPEKLNAVNAIMVDANFVESLSMKLFSSIIGDPSQKIHTCSIATAVKRNLMFLVDISGSSAAETHVRRVVEAQMMDPDLGRGGYFAYPWDQIFAPLPAGKSNADCYTTDGDDELEKEFDKTTYCHWQFLKNFNPDQEWQPGDDFTGPPVTRADYAASHGGQVPVIAHFYEEFAGSDGNEFGSKITVEGPQNDGIYGEVENYEEADLHPDPNEFPNTNLIGKDFILDSLTPPEPLTSIFNALSLGIDELVGRNISGDKAGYIFFEKTLTWSRMVNLTQDTDYLKAIADNDLRTINGNTLSIRTAYGIFPSGLVSEDFTDMYLAFKEAIRQIKDNKAGLNGAPSLDGIVYIGDFLPNCVAKKYLSANQGACEACDGDQNCINTCNERECVDDYTHYSAAINEIWQLIADEFVPNNISLNVIFLGVNVGPHTMDIVHPDEDEGGRCLTDDEARKMGVDYMKGGNKDGLQPADMDQYYKVRSAEYPFYQSGYEAYKLVRTTGGLMKSILGNPPSCVPTTACVADYRREVDRECRTLQQQLSGYLSEIVGSGNPFKIVNTNCDF